MTKIQSRGLFFLFCLFVLVYFYFFLNFLTADEILKNSYPVFGSDSVEYSVLGRNLFSHGVFSMEPGSGQAETFRTPGYPFFVGGLNYLFGNFWSVILVQILLVLLTGFLIYKMGEKICSLYVGLLAAVLYAFDPNTIIHSLIVMSDILYVFVFLASIYYLFFVPKRYSFWLAGGLFGLSILIRPVGLFILPILTVVYLFINYGKDKKKKIFTDILIFVFVSLIVVSPWPIRNKMIEGQFSLSSVGAYNLINYNLSLFLSQRQGKNVELVGKDLEKETGMSIRDQRRLINSPKLKQVAAEHLQGQIVDYGIFHLIRTVPFFFSGGLKIFNEYSKPLLGQAYLNAPTPGLALFRGDFSGAIKMIFSHPLYAMEYLFWFVIFILASLSLFLKKTWRWSLLFLSVAFSFALLTGPVSHPRYRLPASPFLFLSSAVALYALGSTLGKSDKILSFSREMVEKFKKIFIAETNNTSIQFFRYLFVGGVSFLVDFSLLYLLTEAFHIYYLFSSVIAFVFGLFVNYSLSTFWIFKQNVYSDKKREFLIFALIGLFGLGFNQVFLWVFTEILLCYYLLSKIFSTILVFLWNFFARKYVLFSK